MPRANNPTLGTIACDLCGGQADVCQTQRGKGRLLYTRCPDCGTDQRTGSAAQTRLYYQAIWKDGAQIEQPHNLKVREPEIEPDTNEAEPEQEPTENLAAAGSEPESEPKGKGGGLVILAGLLALAVSPLKLFR